MSMDNGTLVRNAAKNWSTVLYDEDKSRECAVVL